MRAAKPDANHAAVRDALRNAGAVVFDVHGSHEMGCDLLVAWRGNLWPVEVKDGSKPPSARRLTANERKAQAVYNSGGVPYFVVESVDDAMRLLNGELPPF